MKKRLSLLSYLLILVMTATAQTKVEIDGFYYDVNTAEKTATLISGSNKYKGDIVIPNSIVIKSFLGGNTKYSVTTIGEGAFSICHELTSIKIPNSITTIEESAFYACSKLTSIEIPNSIKKIGEGAFMGCI